MFLGTPLSTWHHRFRGNMERKCCAYPHLALLTTTHRLYIERMNRLINVIGIQAQNIKKDPQSSATIVTIGLISLNHLEISFRTWSIGFTSGLRADHGITSMLVCWRKSLVTLAEWALILSCWKVYFQDIQKSPSMFWKIAVPNLKLKPIPHSSMSLLSRWMQQYSDFVLSCALYLEDRHQ